MCSAEMAENVVSSFDANGAQRIVHIAQLLNSHCYPLLKSNQGHPSPQSYLISCVCAGWDWQCLPALSLNACMQGKGEGQVQLRITYFPFELLYAKPRDASLVRCLTPQRTRKPCMP